MDPRRRCQGINDGETYATVPRRKTCAGGTSAKALRKVMSAARADFEARDLSPDGASSDPQSEKDHGQRHRGNRESNGQKRRER